MLNELIERIEVCQSKKADGEHQQKLIIQYNCIGSIEIPETVSLPEPDVRLQTKKGVVVSYAAL